MYAHTIDPNAWSRREGSNLRPAVYETAALPAELRRHWLDSSVIVASQFTITNHSAAALQAYLRPMLDPWGKAAQLAG